MYTCLVYLFFYILVLFHYMSFAVIWMGGDQLISINTAVPSDEYILLCVSTFGAPAPRGYNTARSVTVRFCSILIGRHRKPSVTLWMGANVATHKNTAGGRREGVTLPRTRSASCNAPNWPISIKGAVENYFAYRVPFLGPSREKRPQQHIAFSLFLSPKSEGIHWPFFCIGFFFFSTCFALLSVGKGPK